jgi:hypothetical protein
LAVGGIGLFETALNGFGEGAEAGVAGSIETLSFDELPEALNQVKVGGIGGEKEQFDIPCKSEVLYPGTTLITSVVKDPSDGHRKPW